MQLGMRGNGRLECHKFSPMCVATTVLQTHHQVRVMAEGGDGVAGGDSVVTEECLQELLDFFVKSAYRAKTVDRRVSTVCDAAYDSMQLN